MRAVDSVHLIVTDIDLVFLFSGMSVLVHPSDPKSDQHLNSPYSNLAKSFIKIMGIKEIIATL